MSGTFQALARKEMAQHRTAFLVLLGLLGVALASMTLALGVSDNRISYLEVLPGYLRGPVAIAAFLVAGRLVAGEYYARTQRFVEALPVPRARMVVVKFLTGLAFVWLAAAGGVAVALWRAAGEGGVPGDGAALVIARTAAATFCVWCLAFATGFLGRLRVALLVLGVAVAVLLEVRTDVELMRFGPMALTDPRLMPFEYVSLPVRALGESLAVAAACLVVAGVLATVREGSVVESLARPMSHRETTFVLVLCLVAMYALFFASEASRPEPFRFSSPFVERSATAPIEVLYLDPANADAAAAVRRHAEAWRSALVADLGPDAAVPAIYLALSPSRVHGDVTTTRLEPDAVVLEANFLPGPGWDPTDLGTHVLHEAVSAMNHGRLFVEPRHWLADGAVRRWAALAAPARLREAEARRFEARAIAASELTAVGAGTVARWETMLEVLGDEIALSLAWDGVRLLAERHGPQAFAAIARDVLGRPPVGDVRDWLADRRNALPRVYERRTGEPWQAFADAWGADLAARRAASDQRSMRGIDAAIAARAGAGGTRAVHATLRAEPAFDGDVPCRVLHVALDVYDRALGVHETAEAPFTWRAGTAEASHRLDGEYGPGERVFAAVECVLPWLDAWTRLAHVRTTVP